MGNFAMYDTTEVGLLPRGPGDWAVAGYIGGNWPTYWSLPGLYPNHPKLSIAVFASLDAMCLDVEKGDATVPEAPAWVRRQHARGLAQPVLYIQLSNARYLVNTLAQAGIPRSQYKLWTAHYTGREHIEPGSDATQWTDRWAGRNVDASLCLPDFLRAAAPAKPAAPDRLPLAVDGSFGHETIRALQWCLNHKPRAPQLSINGNFGPGTRGRLEHYLRVDGHGGVVCARALQKHVGATVDGDWGPDTTRHLQAALNAHRF